MAGFQMGYTGLNNNPAWEQRGVVGLEVNDNRVVRT